MKLKNILIFIVALFLSVGIKAQVSNNIEINKDLYLIPLGDSIYIHVSYHSLEEFGRFPSNGLFIIRKGKAIMVDTPMDNEKTEMLVSYLNDKMDVQVINLIIGHYHDDCMGGLEYLQSIGVKSLAHELTIEKCQEFNLPLPSASFEDRLSIDFFGEEIICQYFGGGHTRDNITVYLPDNNLLFGGCMIKSMDSRSLGFTGDSDLENWAKSVQNLLKTYPDIHCVIPGHGHHGNHELLKHTIDLVNQENISLPNIE